MAKPKVPEKLNVCMVAEKFPILGRASDHGFLWPIAKGLASHGHNITVLAWKNPQGKKDINQDNVQAYFLGESFARSRTDFPHLALEKFSQLHNKQPFHLVHSIDSTGLQIGLNKKKFKIAMSYDVEATEISKLISIMAMAQDKALNQIRAGVKVAFKFLKSYLQKDRRILKTADGVFTTSPQQKLILERHYLYPDLKTFVIPYGLEVGDLSPKEKSEQLRAELKIPANAQTIVTITDMEDFGEMKSLLWAFEKVAIKKPNARLIVVGDGPLFKQIEFEMLNLALGNKVIFTKSVLAVEQPEYINLADVYVDLSSRTSGFEPSMIEAMAQKKVIIGSELSPISTIVEAGEDGFLIRPADINTLAKLIINIFNQELPTQDIGLKAREKVLNIFDTNKMVNLTLEAYRKTLESSGWYKVPWQIFK